MSKIYIKIDGIHCNHCEDTIKKELLKLENISNVSFNGYIACITYNDKLNYMDIINKINKLGYYTKMEYISDNINDLDNKIKLKEFILISLLIIITIVIIYKIFGFNIFNFIPTIDSNITYGMLFITGVLTSIHCISMCGSINLIASINHDYKISLKRPILYNLGRIISYTLIGGVVGLLGKIITINNIVSGIIIIFASLIMFLMALSMLGIVKFRFKLFNLKLHSRNPFIIGLLNGLMPCGPLQAMQLYALSTGSIIKGSLSMLLFGLGTVPLMLMVGTVLNLVNGKGKVFINKLSSILILFLSLIMFNRGLLALNIDLFEGLNNYDDFVVADIIDNYQVISFDLTYDNYQNIIVQKDIPVKIIINVDKKYLTGCNNEINIDNFNIKQELKIGPNIIEFLPTKTGNITYTCWMDMIKNTIKVVDNIEDYKEN